MSKYRPYKGYALFINYQDEQKLAACRAEIYCSASLLETSEWENTEDLAFLGAQKIIDRWELESKTKR